MILGHHVRVVMISATVFYLQILSPNAPEAAVYYDCIPQVTKFSIRLGVCQGHVALILAVAHASTRTDAALPAAAPGECRVAGAGLCDAARLLRGSALAATQAERPTAENAP
jgi:hypothetical protein